MKETIRIRQLSDNLYNGHPWLEVTIVDTLKNIAAVQASTRVHPGLNTIWEIVNHMISWRSNVLRRVQGEVIKTPGNNYIEPVTDSSEKAWADCLQRLQDTQDAWISFLGKANDEILEGRYPVNAMSYYDHIHGIIQHDAYHLGQIVLLAKMQRPLQPA